MATTPAESSLYPFSTRDAESIPLEIIDPLNLIYRDFLSTGVLVSITITDDFILSSLFATQSCVLLMLGAPVVAGPNIVENTEYENSILIPAQTIITAKLIPGAAKIVAVGGKTGKLFIQGIRKWNALALPQQVRSK